MFPPQIAISLLLLFLAAGSVTTHAATRVWTGKQNGLWSNPANWSNGIVPTHLDSMEFPAEANIREMVNDLTGREFGGLIFKGGRYTLKGNKLFLLGGISSIPGNTTNRIECGIFAGAPINFAGYGYFNLLEFAGEIEVAYPLRIETSSWIRFDGKVKDEERVGVTLAGTGRFSFGAKGEINGLVLLKEGLLELGGEQDVPHVRGRLVVGQNAAPGTVPAARLVWLGPDKIADDTEILLHRSGRLELSGFSDRVGSLAGDGRIELQSGQLAIVAPMPGSEFSGELHGQGKLRVEGSGRHFTLSGQHSFTGAIEVAAAHLHLAGSLSNAVVTVTDLATLTGNGVARSLTATNAVVRPGPGPLRFLEGFTLDPGTLLDAALDGPDAGSVQAGTVHLNQAALRVTYHGLGESNEFALVTASAATTGSSFNGLAEGAWLLAGEPLAPHEFQLTYAGGGGQDVVLRRAGLFVPPVLRIEALSPATHRLAWPRTAQGFTLQRTPTLRPPLWMTADLPAPDIVGDEFQVLDASGHGSFFRLVR